MLLGVDIGGTVAKAAVFDQHGALLGVDATPIPSATPRPGFIERDAEKLWTATVRAIRSVLAAVSGVDLRGIAVTGYGNGLLLLDEHGRPVGPAIASTDTRAAEIVAGWQAEDKEAAFLRASWNHLWAGQPAALYAWTRAHEPERIRRAAALVHCKDYVRYRLTGDLGAERSDLSSAGLLAQGQDRYPVDGLRDLGVGKLSDLLPSRPLAPNEPAGHVTAEAARTTGLRPGTPVSAGPSDTLANLLGSGVGDDSMVSVIAGTWSINQCLAATPVDDGSVFATLVSMEPGTHLLAENSPTSTSNLEWFLDCLVRPSRPTGSTEDEIYARCEEQVAGVADDDPRVWFLPFLHGAADDSAATGVFAGLTSYHRQAHLLRAVYEGVVLEHRRHIQRLLVHRRRPRAVRLAGGATRSPVWTQLFADVLGLQVEVPRGTELGALGAAMTAAVATGVHADHRAAVTAMTAVDRTVEPRADHAASWDQRYETYLGLRQAMAPVWAQLHPPPRPDTGDL